VTRHGPYICCVCHGYECRGGGFPNCVQRDPVPSVLAGILDTYGGLRFVITHKDQLKYQVRPTETLIRVRKLRVHQPLAWGDIPGATARIEYEVDRWIKARGIPNDPHQREAVVMYRLRQQEHPQSKRSLDLGAICET